MRQKYAKIAGGIILAAAATLLPGCSQKTPLESASFRPDMRISHFTSYNYHHSALSWKLEAAESSYYLDENRSIAESVLLHYYTDDTVRAVIQADRAIINTRTKDIELIGDVDALSPSGNRLFTERIQWHHLEKYLDTDEPVKIIRKNGDVIEGIGLRANYDLEDYELKNVRAVTKRSDAILERKR